MTEPAYTKQEKIAAISIGIIGVLGLVLNTLYKPELPLPNSAILLMFPIFICRVIGLKRTCGLLLIIVSLMIGTDLWENFQTTALFLALGVFSNGLVITLNKGMPVQGRIEPSGIHIPEDPRTKLRYLCDLSVLGRWSVGDLMIILGLWTNFFLPKT